MISKCTHFLKKELVFTISLVLAIISCFFVPPSATYMEYIDFRVLALLFCLMAVVAGLSALGIFHRLGEFLLQKVSSLRMLAGMLIYLNFFTSMIITNDVALITFVPFTILVLEMADKQNQFIPLIVLETIAANLGSMLTPLGNPQNLYLYTISEMPMGDFVLTMLPYTIVSALLLFGALFLLPKETVTVTENTLADTNASSADNSTGKYLLFLYAILFVLCLLVVLHVLPFPLVLALVIFAMLIFDRKILCKVDYTLLLTFTCFFIFIGNMKNIPAIHSLLSELIAGNEFLGGVLSSQLISNVPAAILLSGFTTDFKPLLIGVNVGGLGTLIASLASLISYKFYVGTKDSKTGRYMGIFTLYNLLFLIVLILTFLLL